MFKATHKKNIGAFICVSILVGGIFLYFFNKKDDRDTKISIPIRPTPTPITVQIKDKSWPSPDGKKTLIMKTEKSSPDMTTYSFSVTPSASTTGKPLLIKTLKTPSTITIPFNAWSPDNQYFFLQEHYGTETITFVYKASGQMFSDGQYSHNINVLFAEKEPKFLLEDVTGWAAPTLLIVNTKIIDSDKSGPSFWFDISRNSVTRLSTNFE